eukprot:3547598-Amphidinium_carterae.1
MTPLADRSPLEVGAVCWHSIGLPFAAEFGYLGVVFDLQLFPKGMAFVKNKSDRVQAICDCIDAMIKKGTATKLELESLRGRLLFPGQQLFGMGLRQVLALLRPSSRTLTEQDVLHLEFASSWVCSARPKEIGCKRFPLALLFTDGAAEVDAVTCGAVLFLPSGRTLAFGTK